MRESFGHFRSGKLPFYSSCDLYGAKLRVSGSVCTAVSKRKVQVTVAGNTCVRKCGFAETHSLNSRIREFSEAAELLFAMSLSVNSTDKYI